MPERVSSPRFVGRHAELTRLETMWKTVVADEAAATVLISGEAGVGKTRLVAELQSRLGQPSLVLTGSCIEVVDRALPFGPIVQALRSLHRDLDPVTFDAVIGPARDELAVLLPEQLHGTSTTGDAQLGTTALFEQILGVLERLGDRVPTLFVLEDLHWSDRSTRDLFVFLARSLSCARVMLLGTYRSDDLHRRHPLRSALAELDRSGRSTRVELSRFNRDEIRDLIAAIIGGDPQPELVDRTYARSDGNAFFAEELLATAETDPDALPTTLREIVLARVDALNPSARQVLRCASVIGRRADHRLLAELVNLPEPLLLEALRDAVLEQILVADEDGVGYRFRHALMREVIYDDLLPGERVQLHTRVAQLLAEHPDWFPGGQGELASELACHWDSAHDGPRALASAMEAAHVAEHMYAYSEAQAHVERALTLWANVPDAEALTGMRHLDVLRYAAVQADMAGDSGRALDFVRAALDEVDPETDPVTAGLLHDRCARFLWAVGSPWSEILEQCDEAVRLVPPQPSEARARVLATRGQHLMLAGRNEQAKDSANDAIMIAQLIDAPVIEGHARNSLGAALTGTGHYEAGLEQLHRARELAIATRSWGDVARAAINEASALLTLARYEEALALLREGAQVARDHGIDRSVGAFLRLNAVEALWASGRWDEADEELREVESILPVGVEAWRASEMRSLLAAGRGRFDTARAEADDVRAVADGFLDTREQLVLDLLDSAIAVWEGDRTTAIDRAQEAVHRTIRDSRLCHDVGIDLLLVGISATGPESADAARDFAHTFELWVAEERWGGGRRGDLEAITANVHADLSRATGTDDPETWTRVAEQWKRFSAQPRVAYSLWRAAEAFVARGDRDGATTAARDAHELASTIGWAWVRDGVALLARRARLALDLPVPSALTPAERLGLTPREVEVVELVAQGRTNRQIADALFISTKTASVHVSNILGKLDVTNRGEAAAAARRLGLV
jgi:DNA-binding CsgD family transcriptional regulator